MNLDFTKLIIKGTIQQQWKDILNELLYDTTKINPDDDLERIIYLVSKYSFFIWYLESKEEYEKCGQLNKHLLVLIGEYNYKLKDVNELIASSINSYNTKKNPFTNVK